MSAEQSISTDLTAQPHVLVVDDDSGIRDLVSRYLRAQGFVAMTAKDAAEAKDMLKHFAFDVLVVDVMMPGESGLDLTRFVQANIGAPVILLTALGESGDRISGLEAGADDYLPKPFEPRELVLRLNAILRRTSSAQHAAKPFGIGRWQFDPALKILQDGNETQQLTDAEAALIAALGSKPGQILSREDLARMCGLDAGERTIDVQVTRLRRKIEEDTRAPRYLQTVRGKGYLLRIEER